MSAVDGRAFAWEMAANLLDWAGNARQKITKDKEYNRDTPMPPLYHAVLAEAAVYAELAKAETVIGFAGGDWLERKLADERERAEMRESLLEKMKERDRPTEGENE
jgi:ATP phosphoribosyltransferase